MTKKRRIQKPALNFIKVSLPESSLKGWLSSNRKQNKLKLTKQSFLVMTLRKKFLAPPGLGNRSLA
jgi:hypothetical protein